ncbi:UPF0193 protein EVG1-like [Clavelina lepadiformis]|uniref:UPF0193 protein EVG1-like n=1 Tax=Clavelina lepadiformis TaxID=159417 RepID=UPI004040F0FB
MSTRQPVAQGGMFGASAQAPLSNQTKELLKVMMEESKLSNFQRRKLNETVQNGRSLPVQVAPSSSERAHKIVPFPPPQKAFSMKGRLPSSMRTREDIEESGAYERPQFVPKPIKSLEKEKDRLSNIMAYGEDVKPKSKQQILQERRRKTDLPQVDRFDEIEREIEERKQFLADMEKVGQGKNYRPIISSQISQLIKEMEDIDKQRTAQLVRAMYDQDDEDNS